MFLLPGWLISLYSRVRFSGFPWGGTSSVGRASPCQGEGRGFETRVPLHFLTPGVSCGRFTDGCHRASPRWPAVTLPCTLYHPVATDCGYTSGISGQSFGYSNGPSSAPPRPDRRPHRAAVRRNYACSGRDFLVEAQAVRASDSTRDCGDYRGVTAPHRYWRTHTALALASPPTARVAPAPQGEHLDISVALLGFQQGEATLNESLPDINEFDFEINVFLPKGELLRWAHARPESHGEVPLPPGFGKCRKERQHLLDGKGVDINLLLPLFLKPSMRIFRHELALIG